MGRNSVNELSIEHLFSDYSGLVTYIAESERLLADPEVFVLASEMCNTSYFHLSNTIGSNGSGAGLTYKDAYYSTLGEGAERYALSVMNPDNLLFGSYNELKDKYKLVLPENWNLFAKEQFGKIPFSELSGTTKITWTLADDLLLKEEILIPACAVFLPYQPPFLDQREMLPYPSVSTGAACATCANEAILKGIYELIERDSFMICWRNRLPIPEIIIDESSSIYEVFNRRFRRRHLNFRLFYTKLDIEIHSVFGLLYVTEKNSDQTSVYCGGACHHDPEVAVMKTLLEIVQGLKWGDFSRDERFKANEDFSNITSFKDRMLLYSSGDHNEAFSFLNANPKINLSEIPTAINRSTKECLRSILNDLEKNNLHVYAVDVTPVDIEQCNLKVVKVLIPEFETMEGNYNWPFLGKTRYKEVPEKAGYTAADTINPFPHPYP